MKRSAHPVVRISRRFVFDSAHHLPGAPDGHRCRRPHGHTYTLEVELRGTFDNDSAWVMDYGDLKKVVQPHVDALDHHNLNEIEGLHFTTAEEIAVWFWERLKAELPGLSRVTVFETPMTRCDYLGELN